MTRYVVDYEADYAPRRSRLTTFFRALLLIPHLLVLTVVGIAAAVAVVIAWFSLVLTARLPAGLYRFLVGVLRLASQVSGYALLVTDRFPPFSLDARDYPVRVVAPAEPLARYSRPKAFLRLLLAIPWAIVGTAYLYVAYFAAIGSWFAIVVTGRQPEVLQRGLNMGLAGQVRYNAFSYLVAEAWPPFEPELRLEPRAVEPGPEAPALSGA